MAIHPIKQQDGTHTYCISLCGCWRPGAFDTEETAKQAQKLDDDDISLLQKKAIEMNGGPGGLITREMVDTFLSASKV